MLTQEEYGPRLSDLGKINITLQADPLVNGLQGITKLLAEIQQHKEYITTLLVEAIGNKAEADVRLKDAEFTYLRGMDQLLATDKNVQGQKTVEMRKATANNQLTKEMLTHHHSKMDYVQADAYYKSVYQIFNLVDSAKESLSRQISVIQMGIGVGEISREDLGSFFPKSKNDGKMMSLDK